MRCNPLEVALSSASRDNSTCKLYCTLFRKLGSHYCREPPAPAEGAPLHIIGSSIQVTLWIDRRAGRVNHVLAADKIVDAGDQYFLEFILIFANPVSLSFYIFGRIEDIYIFH